MKDHKASSLKDDCENTTSKLTNQTNVGQILKLIHPTNRSTYTFFMDFEPKDLCTYSY